MLSGFAHACQSDGLAVVHVGRNMDNQLLVALTMEIGKWAPLFSQFRLNNDRIIKVASLSGKRCA